jgi:hypothetical protein
MITIEMNGGGKKVIRVGKLNLVDLARSERQSKTGATTNNHTFKQADDRRNTQPAYNIQLHLGNTHPALTFLCWN